MWREKGEEEGDREKRLWEKGEITERKRERERERIKRKIKRKGK
jgi:hypothetical protein